jgi:hypothetical protein
MLAEWSAECGADDPVLVVPWSGSSSTLEDGKTAGDAGLRFVDLRANPYDLDHVPEAELHPALLQALRSLNAARSPVFTAKCDAWTADADELEALHLNLALAAGEQSCGFGSYIDLVWRERAIFVSFHQQEHRLDRLVRLLEPVDLPLAAVEAVLRPAVVDLTGPAEGFSVSLYVRALGANAAGAYLTWSTALKAVVTTLRSREFTLI